MSETFARQLIEKPCGETTGELFKEEHPAIFWVDWREEDDRIVTLAAEAAGRPDLQPQWIGEKLHIDFGGALTEVPLQREAGDRDITLRALSQALRPQLEVRFVKASDGGDTLAFMIMPAEHWRRLDADFGDKVAEAFGRVEATSCFFSAAPAEVRQPEAEATGEMPRVQALQEAAERGDVNSQFELAWRYQERGMYAEAVHWYRITAQQVDRNPIDSADMFHNGSASQCNLADKYEHGLGVPQHLALAAYWYGKSAALDNCVAQYSLGYMYLDGRGVPKDIERARGFFARSAAQGYADAAAALRGMKRDLEEIRKLPVGIRVTHSPNPVAAVEKNDGHTPFAWEFQTRVEAIDADLTLIEFGAFRQLEGRWLFATYTSEPFTPKDFSAWYTCGGGLLKKGMAFTDPRNWSRSSRLRAGGTIWYYVAEDVAGQRFYGEALVEELAELLPRPPVPPAPVVESDPFDEDRYERGRLRALYDAFLSHEGPGAWEAVFLANGPRTSLAREYFLAIGDRAPGSRGWPETKSGEPMNLYCASRLSDTMLMSFQPPGDHDPWPGQDITLEQYVVFWEQLGFSAVRPAQFHPFCCEIVEVIQDETAGEMAEPEIVEVLWPALTLGKLMFSRAGVRVRAPSRLLMAGVADRSCLYWAYRRRYRQASDLSHGWGSNSQWRTDLRLDFDLGDRYVYNVDSHHPVEVAALPEGHQDLQGLSRAERIDLLRHRCLTRPVAPGEREFWVYDDYYEEPKSAQSP